MAPAVGRAIDCQSARVRERSAHRREHEPPPVRDSRWRRSIGRRAVAELALGVMAPAVGRADGRDAAGVTEPGVQRNEAEPARDSRRCRPIARRPVAELAVGVIAPAVAVTIGRHPAGVHVPRAHGNECQKGQRRRGGRRGGLSRNLFTITADDACGEGRREDDEEATHATVLPARLPAGSYSSGDPL